MQYVCTERPGINGPITYTSNVPDKRILFTGDLVFVGGHPVLWDGPIDNWIGICDHILGMDVDVIVPGHGPIAEKPAVRELKSYFVISAQYVAQSKPDGYTILMGTNTLPVNQAVYKSLGYSLLDDLMPVSMIGSYPTYLIVAPNSPFNSVQELLAFGKANPDKLNSGGSSTAFQLVNQLLTLRSGAKIEYVGYKGTNETIAAVAGGELTMAFVDAPVAAEPIRTGKEGAGRYFCKT